MLFLLWRGYLECFLYNVIAVAVLHHLVERLVEVPIGGRVVDYLVYDALNVAVNTILQAFLYHVAGELVVA